MDEYFEDIKTESELKARYKELAKQYHPDKGGDIEVMKIINAEYDRLLKMILSGQSIFGTSLEDRLKLEKVLREKIEKIANLDDIIIELMGSWIWVTGETKQCKDVLKEANFKWARVKKAWYFHEGNYVRRHNKDYNLTDIRNAHGSISINKTNFKRKAIA